MTLFLVDLLRQEIGSKLFYVLNLQFQIFFNEIDVNLFVNYGSTFMPALQ